MMQKSPVALSIAALRAALVPRFAANEMYFICVLHLAYPLQIVSVRSVLPSLTMICSMFTPPPQFAFFYFFDNAFNAPRYAVFTIVNGGDYTVFHAVIFLELLFSAFQK